MDGSLMARDMRQQALVAQLQTVEDFATAREVIRAWAAEHRLQPCTTIAEATELLISYHDEAGGEFNYGCRQFRIPYTPKQATCFLSAYQAQRDRW